MFKAAALIFAAVTAAAPDAPAPPGRIAIGQPSYSGAGCAPNTVTARLNSVGDKVGLFFSRPVGETTRIGTYECRFELPITVPQGATVSIDGYSYSGTVTLADGASADLTVEYSLAGHNGLPYRLHFDGPRTDHPFAYAPMLAGAVTASSFCGLPARLIGSVRVQLRSGGGEAAMTIAPGPLDFSGLTYHLSTDPC